MSKYHYINFPISLLRQFNSELNIKEVFGIIIGYSFWNHAINLQITPHDIIKHLHYLSFRGLEDLPEEIQFMFESDPELNEEYRFFNHINDEYEEFYQDIFEQLEGAFDLSEYEDSIRIKRSEKALGITIGSIRKIKKEYARAIKLITEVEEQCGPSPYCGIRTDIMFDARDGKIPLDQFLLSASVSSVIGKRRFTKTYKVVLLTRMLGAKNKQDLDPLLRGEQAKEFYDHYSIRYQWDKLLRQSINRGFFSKLAFGRGFFISTQYNLEELTKAIIERRDAYDEKIRQENDSRELLRQHQRTRKKAS